MLSTKYQIYCKHLIYHPALLQNSSELINICKCFWFACEMFVFRCQARGLGWGSFYGVPEPCWEEAAGGSDRVGWGGGMALGAQNLCLPSGHHTGGQWHLDPQHYGGVFRWDQQSSLRLSQLPFPRTMLKLWAWRNLEFKSIDSRCVWWVILFMHDQELFQLSFWVPWKRDFFTCFCCYDK